MSTTSILLRTGLSVLVVGAATISGITAMLLGLVFLMTGDATCSDRPSIPCEGLSGTQAGAGTLLAMLLCTTFLLLLLPLWRVRRR